MAIATGVCTCYQYGLAQLTANDKMFVDFYWGWMAIRWVSALLVFFGVMHYFTLSGMISAKQDK